MKQILCGIIIHKTKTSTLRYILFFLLLSYAPGQHCILKAQEETAPEKYRIIFTDKANSPFSTDRPEEFLSAKAIERRQKQDIPIDDKDIPVNPYYIEEVKSTGARILTVSKWFNAVTIQNANPAILQQIMTLPFVRQVPLKTISSCQYKNKELVIADKAKTTAFDYWSSFRQIAIHNGDKLHNAGYTGKGIQIAVLDAGFYHADLYDALGDLWERNQILGYRDFVNPYSSFFEEHYHGTSVLSVLAGMMPGYLAGSAPDAGYWLLRSEDANSEYIIEEDNWIAAAEYADSAGVDIINTSLGYSIFHEPGQNHSYDDMDGNSTRISVAADIAASKGMLVVVSAGNEGNGTWKYITAPADADSILTVGAIDSLRFIAGFSGRGPTVDGRIKPDVCAMGVRTFSINAYGIPARLNGTSFSAPVISGLAACLWQANPEASAMEIKDAIKESADRFSNPDTLYGYGIPDFNMANILLKRRRLQPDQSVPVTIFPIPFSSDIYIWFNTETPSEIEIILCDISGKIVYNAEQETESGKEYIRVCEGLAHLVQGIYIIRITSDYWQYSTRLIKI